MPEESHREMPTRRNRRSTLVPAEAARPPRPKVVPLRQRHPQLVGSLLIVTYGRSGSTLLQSMLQTIPGAHIAGENYNALHPIFQSVRRAQRTKRTKVKPALPSKMGQATSK